MYWNTKIVPRIPAVQGGIISEEGEELYTTNQEVVSPLSATISAPLGRTRCYGTTELTSQTGIFRNMQGILKAVEQGVRIFVPSEFILYKSGGTV